MKKILIIQTMILTAVCTFGQQTLTVEPDCGLENRGSSYAVESENGYLVGLYANDYDFLISEYAHGGTILEMDEDLVQLSGITFRKNTDDDNQYLKVVDVERKENNGSDEGYVAVGYYESEKNSCSVGSGSGSGYNSRTSFLFASNSLASGMVTKDVNIDFDISITGGPYYGITTATDVMYDGTYFVVTGYVELPNALGIECSGLTVMTAADEANRYLPFLAKYQVHFTAGSTVITKIYEEVFWPERNSERESFIPNRIMQNPNNSHYILVGRWWTERKSEFSVGVAAQMFVFSDLVSGDVKIRSAKALLDYASEVTQVKAGYSYSDDNDKYGFFIAGNDLSSSQENGFFRVTDKSFIPMGTLDIEDPGTKSINIIDFDMTCDDGQVILLGNRDDEAIAFRTKINGSISISTTFTYSIIDNAGYGFDEKLSRKYPDMYVPKTLFNNGRRSLIWGYGSISDAIVHTEIETNLFLNSGSDSYNEITLSVGANTNYSNYKYEGAELVTETKSLTSINNDNLFTDVRYCNPYFYSEPVSTSIEPNDDIENVVVKSINLFPNPADEIITIESVDEINTIRVFDLTGKGQIVKENIITNRIDLDVSMLPIGIYKIQISTNLGTKVKTFVKQ